jgi:hypothetical protein
MLGYFVYTVFVFFGFAVWGILFWSMRRGTPESRRKVGRLFVGPLHDYLEHRNYQLTSRELYGWGLVLLVMLIAPLLTIWLEGS